MQGLRRDIIYKSKSSLYFQLGVESNGVGSGTVLRYMNTFYFTPFDR